MPSGWACVALREREREREREGERETHVDSPADLGVKVALVLPAKETLGDAGGEDEAIDAALSEPLVLTASCAR